MLELIASCRNGQIGLNAIQDVSKNSFKKGIEGWLCILPPMEHRVHQELKKGVVFAKTTRFIIAYQGATKSWK